MKITNEKLVQLNMVLMRIASGDGSARLKWAVNTNRTRIEGEMAALETARTEYLGTEEEREKLLELEKEWTKLREATIFEDCLRNEDGSPVVGPGGSFQFENNTAFQAKLDDLQRKKFPKLVAAQKKRDEAYQSLMKEEVEVSNFPYPIKWSFVDLDKEGRLVGMRGEEQFVLMSAGMFDGEPPWLNEEPPKEDDPEKEEKADDEKGKE